LQKKQNFSSILFGTGFPVPSWAAGAAPAFRVKVEYGSNRVIRGGSWGNDADNCRASYRNTNDPANRDNNVGFRLSSSLLRPKYIVYG
jgi:formylglycine-generating enzyme required for sulfatase activity